MNTPSKICLHLHAAILSLIMLGCNPEQDNKALLTIKSTTQPNSTIKVTLIKNLDQIRLADAATDSAGNASFEIALNNPTFAFIQIGKKYGEVYLEPGCRLLIKENGQDYKVPLTFSGEGADVNNYISWVNSNVERIKWASGKGLLELNMKEFRHRFDSLKATIKAFHEDFRDSVSLSEDILSTLRYKNSLKFLVVQEEFRFFKLNDLINEKWEAHRNGEEYLSANTWKELAEPGDQVPLDSALLVGAYADYERLIHLLWYNKVYLPISGEVIGTEHPKKTIPLLSVARIKKADRPEAVRESLLAFNVKFWLGVNGITSETDSIFNDFESTHRQSGYLASLNKTYDEFLALAPGRPAPEFEGRTPASKKVSIKDLRGKIVYVDIWATWCKPCIAEIPSSIELQQKFANEEGIQFLNVSVDNNKSAWKKFLDKNNNWTGIHINIAAEQADSLYSTYKLSGIPAYILIDQAGNMIDLKALRPSDEKLEIQIRKLLAG